MGVFERETEIVRVADDEWSVELHRMWAIGDNLNGGYAIAPVFRAFAELAEGEPLTATAHFLRPVPSGAGEGRVTATVVRQGRSTTVVTGSLSTGGELRATVTAVFGTMRWGGEEITIGPPELPPPDDCLDRSQLGQGVPIPLMERLEVRVDPSTLSGDPVRRPVVQGWVRFTDFAPPPLSALALFADSFPPALIATRAQLGWVPTVELTVHARNRPAAGWVRARFECDDLTGGTMIESGTLWDSNGAVLARSRQLGVVRSA